jgi:hypothetical protein
MSQKPGLLAIAKYHQKCEQYLISLAPWAVQEKISFSPSSIAIPEQPRQIHNMAEAWFAHTKRVS